MEEQQRGEKEIGSLSLDQKSHRHDYKEVAGDPMLVCSCGKKVLNLERGKQDGVLIGEKSDGSPYSVRNDRRRYFFPDEWEAFIKTITNKTHSFFFYTALHTGGRAMEILNLKHKDIDEKRMTVEFRVVKQRRAKKNAFATGTSRKFFVADGLIKEYRKLVRGTIPNQDEYIFLDNSKLPADYDYLENTKKKEHYQIRYIAYSQMLKRKLRKAGLPAYEFSLHNIRKTYGMWMRALQFETKELCYRLGHDEETYQAHYGSSIIFDDAQKRMIAKILGEVR